MEVLGVFIGLIMCAFSFYYFYCQVIYPIKQANAQDTASKLESCLTFDEKTNVLHLHSQHPKIEKIVKMERYEILHTGYQPETVTYTSVTVGNVTTGGVSHNDAYKYISGTSKTEKYKLVYLGKEIKTIKLCNSTVRKKAEQIGLQEYMNSNGDIMVVKGVRVSREAAQMALSGYYSPMQNELLPGYPTEDKCRKILDFLCDDGLSN